MWSKFHFAAQLNLFCWHSALIKNNKKNKWKQGRERWCGHALNSICKMELWASIMLKLGAGWLTDCLANWHRLNKDNMLQEGTYFSCPTPPPLSPFVLSFYSSVLALPYSLPSCYHLFFLPPPPLFYLRPFVCGGFTVTGGSCWWHLARGKYKKNGGHIHKCISIYRMYIYI